MEAKQKKRITFKIKTGCYLDLLTPEMLKLLRSTEKKLRKIKITIKILNVNQNKKCFSFRNQ